MQGCAEDQDPVGCGVVLRGRGRAERAEVAPLQSHKIPVNLSQFSRNYQRIWESCVCALRFAFFPTDIRIRS